MKPGQLFVVLTTFALAGLVIVHSRLAQVSIDAKGGRN
jgi:hypothetical protein